jgi:glycosyltransferase involved in cell wall biosynthesis
MGRVNPRLAVALTFPVHPPLGGGQVRAHNLYRGLAQYFDIELVSLLPVGEERRRIQLTDGMWETGIPKSEDHEAAELALGMQVGTSITDIAMVDLYQLTPAYVSALRDAARGAHAAVACHPYTFPALRAATDIPVWYEAQDVEASLKAGLLGSGDTAQDLLASTERVERACCQDAELIWACSDEDRRELVSRYDVDPKRVLVVPNGVNLEEVSFVPPDQRRRLKRRLRVEERVMAMFMASYHPPNIVGARRLVELAEQLSDVQFVVLGSVAWAFEGAWVPSNLQFTGPVDLGFKRSVLSVSDVALNPVTTGSGTNLKMLDYFGSGIPVISTAFGARGLGVSPGNHFLPAEPLEFARVLQELASLPETLLSTMVQSARSLVESRLSWTVIADELLSALHERANDSAVPLPSGRSVH